MRTEQDFPVTFGHQAASGVLNRLRCYAGQGRTAARIGAKVALKALRPVISHIQRKRPFITAELYDYPLVMRGDHRLPEILAFCPTFNAPLKFLAETLTEDGRTLSVIDVGANIGDTVALIEQSCPGQVHYLCIEPDPEFSQLCAYNLRNIPGVQLISELIGDLEGAEVTLVEHLPGTAATRMGVPGWATGAPARRVARLDRVAAEFVSAHGLGLLKCDTDGFDFSVLRSAQSLLETRRPALLFEWHPDLWIKANEDPLAVFPFLRHNGYSDLAFFTNQGQFFCTTQPGERRLFEGLRDLCLARCPLDDFHFDVLAADERLCNRVVGKSLCSLKTAKH